jgi:alpha-mannosidase II
MKALGEKTKSQFPKDDLFNLLVKARRNLGVFQHHDGVTGTSKDHVVNDYGLKLQTAITSSETIMEQSAGYLLYQNDYSFDKDILLSNTQFKTFESLPTRRLISLDKQQQAFK